jgi:hypothetical protein
MLTYKGKEVRITLKAAKRPTCNLVDNDGNVYLGVPLKEVKEKQPKTVAPTPDYVKEAAEKPKKEKETEEK